MKLTSFFLALSSFVVSEAFGVLSRPNPTWTKPRYRRQPGFDDARRRFGDADAIGRKNDEIEGLRSHSLGGEAPVVSSVLSSLVGGAAARNPLWVEICGQIGPIASILLFLAPLPTLRQIARDRSVGGLPLLPYTSMVLNCFLWLTYGILRNEAKVWTVNLFGLAFGVHYVTRYLKYYVNPLEQDKSRFMPGLAQPQIIGSAFIMMATILLAFASKWIPRAVDIIGNGCVVLCLALFSSPLAALGTVLETKSACSIPLPFTLATLANCISWSVWGIFAMKDANIYVPNILGTAFGLAQVALKLYYGNGPYEECPV